MNITIPNSLDDFAWLLKNAFIFLHVQKGVSSDWFYVDWYFIYTIY